MATIMQETRCELAQRELVCIADAHGQAISCDSGELWITVDGDPRDIILHKGETWLIESNAEVVISAMKASTLSVRHNLAPGLRTSGAKRLPWSPRGREFSPLAAFRAQAMR